MQDSKVNEMTRDELFNSLKIVLLRFKSATSIDNPMSKFTPQEIIDEILPTMNNLDEWLDKNANASHSDLLHQRSILYKKVDPFLENIKKKQKEFLDNLTVDDVKDLKRL